MLSDARFDRNLTLLAEARRIVDWAQEAGLSARLLGGTAILHQCVNAQLRGDFREIADIDILIPRNESRALARILDAQGYVPEPRFNARNSPDRLLYYGQLGRIDVLGGTFRMCHELKLVPRLHVDYPTLSVSDLLLTKLQIVELNEKDASDALTILAEKAVATDDDGVINASYLASIIRDDWGLWRTISGTLARLREMASDPAVVVKIEQIEFAMANSRKTLRFRLRASVGERLIWYLLPDEVAN